MHDINHDFILAKLRATGASLKRSFAIMEPQVDRDEMMEAFHRIDSAAARGLRRAVSAAYPGIAWLDDDAQGGPAWDRDSGAPFWVCDAIDGAVQYLRALPQWCCSLTLVSGGQAVFAAIYDALHEELFHAVHGGGAFLNGQAIRVNICRTLRHSVIASSHPPFAQSSAHDADPAARALSLMLTEAFAVRNFGPSSLQLAYVACGRLDGFWGHGEDGFNCLGGALLVREAGGVVSDAHGAPYSIQADAIVAAPGLVHQAMLDKLMPLPSQRKRSMADLHPPYESGYRS